MEDEIEESASLAMGRMEKGHYDFTVKNYSLHKGIGVGEAIESEEFTVGGHRWTVCLYPNGKFVQAYDAGNASLFISLVSETPPYTYINCLHDLHILDQSGKGNHEGECLIKSDASASTLKKGEFSGYIHFMKRSDLESPDYLKDDCLNISCTIGVLTRHTVNLPVIKVPKCNVGAKLFESKIGVDVLFKVENQFFWAHKWVLAAHSPVFRSRLSDCHQSHEIVIPDMEPRIFKAMLWFLYTGNLPEEGQEAISDAGQFMPESFLGKMLAAADRFDLEKLKKLCLSHILETLSEESVAYNFYLANLYNATELKDACLRFAAENKDAVMQSDGCGYLRRSCPSLFRELAGCKGNLSCGGVDHRFCGKILVAVEESLFGVFRPRNGIHNKSKIKEV